MDYTYRTKGTCSREISFELDGDRVKNVHFVGGCDGNLKAVAKLVDGMTVGPFWSRHKVRVQDGKQVAGQVIDFLLDQQYVEPIDGGSYRLKK